MGLYLKQEQQDSQLQKNLAKDLEKRLQVKPNAPNHPVHAEQSLPSELSISKTWGAVFIVGGIVGLLLGFIVHQDPSVMHEPGTKVLAASGVAALLFGTLLLMIGHKHHSGSTN